MTNPDAGRTDTPETDAFGMLPMHAPLVALNAKQSAALSKLCAGWGNLARRLERERDQAREALMYYADPDTYFAIGMMGDPPCGDFVNDWDIPSAEWSENDNSMEVYRPGKKARAALSGRKEG